MVKILLLITTFILIITYPKDQKATFCLNLLFLITFSEYRKYEAEGGVIVTNTLYNAHIE